MVYSEKYVKYYARFGLGIIYVIVYCVLLWYGVASLMAARDIDQRTAGTNADRADSPASISFH